MVRPFLTQQSDLSVVNGPFQIKPKSGFVVRSRIIFFFDPSSSRDRPVGKLSRKSFPHVFSTHIASLVPPPNTHPHAHTPILAETTQQYNATAPKLAWLSLLASRRNAGQRGAFLAPLPPAAYITRRQQPAVVMPFCQQWLRLLWLWSLSAECKSSKVEFSRLSAKRNTTKPPTRLDEGLSRVHHELLAENMPSTELPTDFRLP